MPGIVQVPGRGTQRWCAGSERLTLWVSWEAELEGCIESPLLHVPSFGGQCRVAVKGTHSRREDRPPSQCPLPLLAPSPGVRAIDVPEGSKAVPKGCSPTQGTAQQRVTLSEASTAPELASRLLQVRLGTKES